MRGLVQTVILALIASTLSPLRAQNDPESRREAIEAIYPVMIAALEAKNFGRARNICDQAIIWEPQNPVHHYNLACIEAQAGGNRLPYAMNELELAVALGFNDATHLKNDSDLEPLHNDPKFTELVRKVTLNATAIDALTEIKIPPTPTKSDASPAAGPAESAKPASADFKHGVPVGLYFMTRYWLATRTLEKAAWYFAPDGTVFENLEHGVSPNDLAAHTGRKGKAAANGNKLEVTWTDGKKTASEVERDGTSFTWDMGIFTTVRPFEEASEIAGIYEGGESVSGGGNAAAVSKRLELRGDGTFISEGVSFVSATSGTGKVSAGSTGATKGRWQLKDYSLVLTDEKGAVLRGIVFPYEDDRNPTQPARMYFGGLMYKRQQ